MSHTQASAAASTESTSPEPGVGVTIAKNSFWLLSDSVVSMIASFYCSIMVARHLGPDRMGEYNYLVAFTFVLKTLTEIAIPATFRKFAAEVMGRKDYVALKTMVRVALRLQTKLAAIGLAAGLAFVFLTVPADYRLIAVIAVATVLPGIFISVPSGALWATENLSYNVISSVTGMIANMTAVSLAV